jgi:hypothetical protein
MSTTLKILCYVLLVAVSQLAGCASTTPDASEAAQSDVIRGDYVAGEVIDDAEVASMVHWSNAQYLLSVNDKQQVVLNNLEGGMPTKIVSDVTDDGNAKRIYISSAAAGKRLHVAWMEKNTKPRGKSEKTGAKYITYSAIADAGKVASNPRRISSGGGAFIPMLKANATGDVCAIWADERNGGRYDIFLNYSNDHGATWQTDDIKLTGDSHLFVIDPAIEVVGDKVVVAWVQTDVRDTFTVVTRTSMDRGATWSELRTIYKESSQPVTPKLTYGTNGLTACWATALGAGCAGSGDFGTAWTKWAKVEGTDRTGLVLTQVDPQGRTHLVSNQRSEDGKSAGLFYSHGDGTSGFTAATPVSRKPLYQSKAIAPALAVDSKGGVFIAWMDYFYIKPLVAATFSVDGGKSWREPYVLSYFGRTDEQLFPVVNSNTDGGVTLAYLSAGQKRNQWISFETPLAAPQNAYAPKLDVNQLKSRAAKYWDTRVKGDWKKSYEFMDPYYRQKVTQAAYVQTQGQVKYYGFSLKDEPVLSGVRAMINVSYDSEVPQFMLGGKMVSIPRKETTTNQSWVWLDGEWYVVFEDLMGNTSLPN